MAKHLLSVTQQTDSCIIGIDGFYCSTFNFCVVVFFCFVCVLFVCLFWFSTVLDSVHQPKRTSFIYTLTQFWKEGKQLFLLKRAFLLFIPEVIFNFARLLLKVATILQDGTCCFFCRIKCNLMSHSLLCNFLGFWTLSRTIDKKLPKEECKGKFGKP